jgi:transcriptional regulator GlxA family with amidase domain
VTSRLKHVSDWEKLGRQAKFRCADMAALCSVSERQLERFFISILKERPKHWLQILRMRAALDMMEAGYSTKAAAAELHFSGPSQFIRAFKKFYNKSPQEFAPMSACRI